MRLWRGLCGREGREAYWANLELAKYYEHRAKDINQAHHHAQIATRICPYGSNHRPGLNRRLKRLSAKTKR